MRDFETFEEEVLAIIKPRGGFRPAINAVVHWAKDSPHDIRGKHLVDAAFSADGPRVVARALCAGSWSGKGLYDLWYLLVNDRLKLAALIIGVPEQ